MNRGIYSPFTVKKTPLRHRGVGGCVAPDGVKTY